MHRRELLRLLTRNNPDSTFRGNLLDLRMISNSKFINLSFGTIRSTGGDHSDIISVPLLPGLSRYGPH